MWPDLLFLWEQRVLISFCSWDFLGSLSVTGSYRHRTDQSISTSKKYMDTTWSVDLFLYEEKLRLRCSSVACPHSMSLKCVLQVLKMQSLAYCLAFAPSIHWGIKDLQPLQQKPVFKQTFRIPCADPSFWSAVIKCIFLKAVGLAYFLLLFPPLSRDLVTETTWK